MKKIYTYLREISLIIALLVLATGAGWGQDGYDPETGKEIVGPDIPRTALVGPDCLVNTMIDVVNVLGGSDGLNNLIDINIDNYVEIQSVANIGALVDPSVVRVKDRSHIYKEGTIAGFCVESSNESLLKLNVLNMIPIGFYKDDELIKTELVKAGDNSLVSLGLISLPGSKETVLFLEAKAPCDFDEIALMQGGVELTAFSNFKIRYGYVGSPKQTKLINSTGITGFDSDISIGFVDRENIVGDVGKYATQFTTGLFSVEADATLSWENPFPAGSEIGFHIRQNILVDLSLSLSDKIILYKEDGSSQEFPLSRSLLDIKALSFTERDISIIAPFEFNKVKLHISGALLDLGTTHVDYGFVNEPPVIPEYCHIEGLSMDASICGNETTYELRPKDVEWELTKVTNNNEDITSLVNLEWDETDTTKVVSGLTIPGEYIFTATQTNEDGSICTGEVVLKHGLQASSGPCNTPIKNESATDNTYEVAPPRGVSGGIEIFNNIRNRENVINSNDDDYADINPGIALLSNTYVMGIHKTNGTFNPKKEENKRISFLVDLPNTFLNVDALQFFYIMLYKDGEKVGDYSYTVDNWDAISAGLIGSEDFSKMRLGATIPKDVDFDEFALWTGGVASISLSSMRMYSAFVEDESADCDNPLNCDDAVFTGEGALEDAYINYDGTYLPAIGVGVGMTGLENLLSGEFDPSQPDKCVRYSGVVEALSPASIAVNFGRVLGPKQQAGFVVRFETHLASIDVIKVIQVKTYLEGVEQETRSDWGVLNADVIGDGDYEYLMINPKYPYDEIRLVMTSVVGALSNMTVHAVFVRNDSDGDGLPDCIDPNPCSDELTGLSVNPSDICEGEDVILSGSANFSELPKSYQVFVHDGTTEYDMGTLTINDNGAFTYQIKDLSAGIYSLKLIEDLPANSTEQPVEYEGLSFKVHPTRTTWKTLETTTTDWNEWTNWSEGSPWTCTDVIIPSDADTYPVLKSGVMNGCRYIHFEPNAEVVNTHRLTYEKAWVELALHPNRYYMVTVPLKDTYSGDWFIPQTKPTTGMTVRYPEVFSVLDAQSLPENRVTPTVYQRVWAFKTYNKFFDAQGNAQKETLAATTHWSAPYNYLATPYDKNEGGYDYNAVSVWVHPLRPDATEENNLDNLTYTFRFPKEHTLYQYYDEHGTGVNAFESIKREQPGRFIYESKDSTFSFPDTMRFYANSETEDGKKLFLVGNPFMSHLNVLELFKANPHITCIKIGGKYEGKGTVYLSCLRDAGMPIGIMPTPISPMESFFVEQEGDAPYCSIIFTEDMLVSAPKIKLTNSPSKAPNADNTIIINADVLSSTASAMIRFSASASDNYREREDAEILIENETPPAVAIFTTAEDRALDIQQRANGGEIPLGMYLPKPEDVTLRIAVPDEYSGWMVEDVETNRRYPLMPGEETEIHVGRLTTNVGRFYLKGQSATGNETITATQPKLYCYREAGSHTLVVRSGSEMMTRCEVYGMDGRLRHIGQFETDEYRFPAQKGVQIVKAYFKDGITSTVKVF